MNRFYHFKPFLIQLRDFKLYRTFLCYKEIWQKLNTVNLEEKNRAKSVYMITATLLSLHIRSLLFYLLFVLFVDVSIKTYLQRAKRVTCGLLLKGSHMFFHALILAGSQGNCV